jgi:DnaJ-class molecular chaperone
LEEIKKELKQYKDRASQQPKATTQKFIIKDDRPQVPISVYQKVTGKADYATPFEILKIGESATPEQIRQAWKNQIRIWQPDQNKDPEAKDAYMLINWAYATLNK